MFYKGGADRALAIGFELSKTIIATIIVLLIFHLFVATVFMVDGISMEPNMHTGQVVLVNKLAYLTDEPARGDIVVLRFPGDPDHSRYIKRIIGLPGETVDIKAGKVYINNKPLLESYLPANQITEAHEYPHIALGDKEYLVFGDNRLNSSDSRIWGQARQEDLIGRTRFILYPFSDIGYISNIFYN